MIFLSFFQPYDCDFSAERDISQKEKKRQNIHGTKPMNPWKHMTFLRHGASDHSKGRVCL
jgi:hypothetical protein